MTHSIVAITQAYDLTLILLAHVTCLFFALAASVGTPALRTSLKQSKTNNLERRSVQSGAQKQPHYSMQTKTAVFTPSKTFWFLIGFLVSTAAGILYLLCGGEYRFLFGGIPAWAYYFFYPGFQVGWRAYESLKVSPPAAMVLGCIALGFAYGGLAVVGYTLWQKLWRQNREANAP